jgi:hypothetical protein
MSKLSTISRAALLSISVAQTAYAQTDPELGWFATNSHVTLPPSLDVSTIAMVPNIRHQMFGGPRGVPTSYDWYSTSVQHNHNTPPANYTAFIGWGHVVWRSDWPTVSNQSIQIADHSTLICKIVGGRDTWYRLPTRGFQGKAMDPDYVPDTEQASTKTPILNGNGLQVTFAQNWAFHFFPSLRESLGTTPRCGLLYVFRARAVQDNGSPLYYTETPAMMIGGGADYWLSESAPYVDPPNANNASIGVGQFRPVSGKWHWYGFTTAYWPALQALDRDGYTVVTN